MKIRFYKNGPGISIAWLHTYSLTSQGGKVKWKCKLGKISVKWLEAP